MSFPTLIMEDHGHALGFWKELGLSDAICIHVDAHLDVMDRGFTPEILAAVAECRSNKDLEGCASPNYLPWGGVHCGNYLYPALDEGLVSHLIWVVPKGMVGDKHLLEFAQDELPGWVEISLDDFHGLKLVGRTVEGTMGGRRFTLCTSDNIPELEDKPVLLDIDVDYFQDTDDLIWQTPGQLQKEMGLSRIDALTVAYSVDGGYTCLEHRYLGEVTEQIFLEPDSNLEALTNHLLDGDRLRRAPEQDSELYQLDSLFSDEPGWLRAALALKQGLAEGKSVEESAPAAQEHDPAYRYLSSNQALVHFRHGDHERALELLGESAENAFIRAVIAFQGGKFELSKSCWDTFIEQTELSDAERAYALFIRGQCSLQSNELEAGRKDLVESTKLDSSNYQYKLFAGLSLHLCGDLKKAARMWRNALSSHGHLMVSLGLHLELSRLYREMGKVALANAELARVTQKDQTGQYTMVVQMEHLRSRRPAASIPKTSLQGLFGVPMMAGGLR